MKHAIRLLLVAVLVLVCTSALFAQGGPGFAQGPGQGPGPRMQGHGQGSGPGPDMGSGFRHLNLTPDQQKKAQEVFQAAARQQLDLRLQLQAQRKAFAAAKPGTDAEIDKRAADRAQLMGKMQATREKAFAHFYNDVLTAEQRTQLDKQREAHKGGPGQMGHRGMMGHPGMMGGEGMGWGPGPGWNRGW